MHVQRYALLSQLYHISISFLYIFPFSRGLQHKTKYSMLQIKTIPKNILTLTSWNFSPLHTFIYLATISEGITNLARKQLNVNTRMLQLSLAKNKCNNILR